MEENKPILHIIHHNDLDGICAAAIAALYASYGEIKFDIIFYETNYNRPVDVSKMKQGDTLIIVDFSYPPEEMKKITDVIDPSISDGGSLIWIDHHKTAEHYGYNFSGLRDFTDKGPAGCELTWQYFFGHMPMPRAVALIGDYDSWRLAIPESLKFYEGAKLFLLSPQSSDWPLLLNTNDDPLYIISSKDKVDMIQRAGQVALQYRDNYCQSIRKSYGYETILIEPRLNDVHKHYAYAMNLFGFGSGQFGELFKKYPLVIAYIDDGTHYTVSLYSETVDVGEIARSFGGGGHKGAAGFVCEQLPFVKKKLFCEQ